MKISDLLAAGWRLKRDPSDGRLYGAYDTRGAGICYLTSPEGREDAPLSEWIHPAWLSAGEFEALPEAFPPTTAVEQDPYRANLTDDRPYLEPMGRDWDDLFRK
jgi:hypothetical protein